METEIITKTSKISGKTEQSGETNGKSWTRYVFQFEDFKGSTFDAELAGEFKSGDTAKVSFKKSGIYNNIVEMEKVESKPEIKKADEVKEESNVWLEKDKRIVRQNSNERAIELATLMVHMDYDKLQELIKTNGGLINVIDVFAKHFEDRVWA